MSAERPLPDFGNPPVVEVSLGVQFEPIEGLRSAEMGLFWAVQLPLDPDVDVPPPTFD